MSPINGPSTTTRFSKMVLLCGACQSPLLSRMQRMHPAKFPAILERHRRLGEHAIDSASNRSLNLQPGLSHERPKKKQRATARPNSKRPLRNSIHFRFRCNICFRILASWGISKIAICADDYSVITFVAEQHAQRVGGQPEAPIQLYTTQIILRNVLQHDLIVAGKLGFSFLRDIC
jgi:hypothetical protein